MGCLNSEGKFENWFANIHLSGSCNRSCYFCIGQDMMALDSYDNLDTWPLDNIEKFIEHCKDKKISEINVTGSNTDPLLYKHTGELYNFLNEQIPNLNFGIRTNGVLVLSKPEIWQLYDKASISITSLDPEIYEQTMGKGKVPNIEKILSVSQGKAIKVNVVLCPETVYSGDIFKTLDELSDMGIEKVNLREPYGQPHIGNLLEDKFEQQGSRLGMPVYNHKGMDVMYWDVHYVEVESVNLYANGEVSLTYPVTKGHCKKTGMVLGQENFKESGRKRKQWLKYKKLPML